MVPTAERVVLRCVLIVVPCTREDMNAIPKRGSIDDCICEDHAEKLKIAGVSVDEPDEAFHRVRSQREMVGLVKTTRTDWRHICSSLSSALRPGAPCCSACARTT